MRLFTRQKRLYTLVLVGVLYPFFLIWVLMGTIWYAEIHAKTPNCFKDPQHSWYIVLWIVLCYIWIIVYTTLISISAILYFRTRSLESQMESLLSQYQGEPPNLDVSGWSTNGMQPARIQELEFRDLSSCEEQRDSCSICFEELQKRQRVRVLPCEHMFHIACIDPWLIRTANCPLCKRAL